MRLYHFTATANLESIKATGLRPAPDDQHMVAGYAVVWLTATPTMRMTPKQCDVFAAFCGKQRDTIAAFCGAPATSDVWFQNPKGEARSMLTVRVPSNDRLLKRYPTWLRSHPFEGGPVLNDYVKICMAEFWVYFGVIDRAAIVAYDPADALEAA